MTFSGCRASVEPASGLPTYPASDPVASTQPQGKHLDGGHGWILLPRPRDVDGTPPAETLEHYVLSLVGIPRLSALQRGVS